MSAALAGALLAIAFAVASLAADALPRRLRGLPVGLLSALLLLLFIELARYDHGHGEAFFWIGMVVAPLLAIFGGAAWGTRRLYGWPDLGPHPERAGAVGAAILLGVLIGVDVKARDVAASERIATTLRARIEAWREQTGAWPRTLAEAEPDAPATRMGTVDPPAFTYGHDGSERLVLGIPLGGDAYRVLDLATGTWRSQRRAPRPVAARETP